MVRIVIQLLVRQTIYDDMAQTCGVTPPVIVEACQKYDCYDF